MPTALIQFTQGPNTDTAGRAVKGTLTDGALTVSNGDDTGVVAWTFELVYVPPGSAIPTTTQGPGAVSTFVMPQPDVPGSYRFRMTVDDGAGGVDVDIRNFCVPFPHRGLIAPPYQGLPATIPLTGAGSKPNEMNLNGQAFGWDGTDDTDFQLLYQAIQLVDELGPDGEIVGPLAALRMRKQNLVASTLSPADTVDFRLGLRATLTLDQNIGTLTVIPPTLVAGEATHVTLQVKQGSGGGFTIGAYSANVLFPGGTAPTLSANEDEVDILAGVVDGDDAVIRMVASLNFLG